MVGESNLPDLFINKKENMPRTKSPKAAIEMEDDVELHINTKYAYRLLQKNEPRGKVYDLENNRIPDKEFPSRRNLLLKCAIIWDGSDCVYEDNDPKKKLISGHKAGRKILQYYDGCTSLFAEDHTKDREQLSQLISATRDVIFNDGYLFIYGYDDMLKKYVDMASWNGNSPYRIPTAQAIYEAVDAEGIADRETEDVDLVEEALELAREASDKKMFIHARYLGIEEADYKTGNALSPKAIRAKYRKVAMEKPKEFKRSFNDKAIQLKAWIEKAMQNGTINTTSIPNKATWKGSANEICDLSGLTSKELILNKLIGFASSDEGKDFNEQLTALFS